jgi:hypothetical protein
MKSPFKRPLGCSTKSFYKRKESYENLSEADSFLQCLPQVGFQVEEAAENASKSVPEIADDGEALFAYGKLQFIDLTNEERNAINKGLLRYYELDNIGYGYDL